MAVDINVTDPIEITATAVRARNDRFSTRAKSRVRSNRYPAECFRCGITIPEREGVYFKGPLRVVCAACALREDIRDDNGVLERIAKLAGAGLKLHPFQEEDCRRIATTRAILNGAQMGCGKTIETAVAALRNDTANLIFCPASVRDNWGEEIEKWRSDLRGHIVTPATQAAFSARLCDLASAPAPGRVLIGSFGSLPGSPCGGCRSLRGRLQELKKWKEEVCPNPDCASASFKSDGKCLQCGGSLIRVPRPRYTQVWYPICNHVPDEFGIDQNHPAYVDLTIDKRYLRLPYHAKSNVEAWIDMAVELPKRGPVPKAEKLAPSGLCCPGGLEGCAQKNPLPPVTQKIALIVDECHALKTPAALRTRNWRGLREAVWDAGGSVVGLTGTPCEGKPMEFWEVLVSLGLERAAFANWENYYRIFRHWFENPKGDRIPPGGALREELHMRLRRVQINRRRKDVLSQLPPRTEVVVHVDINEKTISDVNEAVHRMLAVNRSWEDVQKGLIHNGSKLLDPFAPQVPADERERRRFVYESRVEYYFQERPWSLDEEIQHAVEEALLSKGQTPTIDQLSRIRSMLSQAKVAAVKEWIEAREAEDEPVVLFSQHVTILKKIATRPGWECFFGGLTAKKRGVMVKEFQRGEIERGLAVSIGAGGEGITLTRAAVCAFIDLSWNPARNQQAESRLIRIGAEAHHDKAAEEARRLAASGECLECRVEENGDVTPCEKHQARIVVVRFIAKHAVDQLVMETLKEKEALLTALEWEEEEQQ